MGNPYPRLKRLIGRAIHRYQLLEEGDRVLLALSGGEDSLVLLRFLAEWRRKTPFAWELFAIHMDMGFETSPEHRQKLARLAEYCEELGVPFRLDFTNYGQMALEAKEKKVSPCFVCSWYRRKHLFKLAGREKYNKIAFGHHKDDVIVTFFLNMCYHGELSTMLPKQEMFKGELYLIRPLYFVEKKLISALAQKEGLPVFENPCPISPETRRAKMERILEEKLFPENPKFKGNIFHAIFNCKPEYLPER
ncbi:MAG TPA: tRNA 2-thiocytidine biosynthesis protein TtcA [Thermodesulfatator atlanticus]|uniref:tRNA 2-thiocytidine biosynthesis protein TtcA n=1 Tax=Thermodesulfatator atlanticus TaxID=501497 RepID=A0A7V5P0K8_9BACT|nr:tRNA 2-thiocytidine biosynthesis protein TtcA [Thermodesulfatator atlanticus]